MKAHLMLVASAALLFGMSAQASEIPAIKAAEQSLMDAAKAGYVWRDTEKMLKQAKHLAAQGKTAEAIQLATIVDAQNRAAIAQSMSEAKRYDSRF